MQLRQQKQKQIRQKTADIMASSPIVIANRLARFASPGAVTNVKDQAEFQRMGAEKVAAFYESWNAMGLEVMRVQQEWAYQSAFAWWPQHAAAKAWPSPVEAALRVIDEGLAPVHRRAVANARRLK
jgi:hypothetical protein